MNKDSKIEITEEERIEYAKSLNVLRKSKGWTLKRMEELTGIPNQTISRYERGINEPTIFQAYKIAKLFDVTIEEMIQGEI